MKGVYFKRPDLTKLNFGKLFLIIKKKKLLCYAKKLLEKITCYIAQKFRNFLLFQPWKTKIIIREETTDLDIHTTVI